MKVFILLACLLVAVYARSAQQKSQEWQLYKAHHGKNYANTKEEQHRMKIFLDNKAFVENHNKRFANGEVSYTVELNKFADLTNEEFVAQYNTYKSHSKKTNVQKMLHTGAQIPASVDWRTSGAVTPVKDQQQCGSCWAFSTTGSIEGQHQIKTGKLVSLSEQQLVDCSTENDGCEGGLMDTAFDYIIAFGGLETEASYPYTAEDDNCKAKKSLIAVSITGYTDVPSGDEKSLTTAVANVGPVSVAIDASNLSFQLYSSGVYDEPECSTSELDHGVLAVGYGTLSGKNYFIVKNSWGADWGQSGYIFMSRNGKNQCGIATESSYPTV